MAFTNKLDTEVITIVMNPSIENPYTYETSLGTIELASVYAYYAFIAPNGDTTNFTAINIGPIPIIVNETYATIDGLINP